MANETATLDLLMRVVGSQEVKRSLNGVVNETKKAEDQIRQEGDKTQKEFKQDSAERTSLTRQEARRALDIVKSAELEKRKEVAKTARELRTSWVSAAKNAVREARSFIKQNPLIVAGGGAAAAGFAIQQSRSAAGIPDLVSGARDSADFSINLIRLSAELGLTAKATDKLQESIIETSGKTLQSSNELLLGISQAQEQFRRVDFVTENLDLLAKAASDSGASFQETVQAAGLFVQNLDLASSDIPEVIGLLKDAQINVKTVSDVFGASLERFVQITGATGKGGAAQFLSLTRSLEAGKTDPAKARKQLEGILTGLSDTGVREKLASPGVGLSKDLRSQLAGSGAVNVADLVEQLAKNPGANLVNLSGVFGDAGALGLTKLIDQTRAAGGTSPLRSSGSAQRGLSDITSSVDAQRGSAAGQLIAARIDAENNLIKNSENLLQVFGLLAKVSGELTTTFPALTLALQAAAVGLGTIGVGSLIKGASGIPGVTKGAGALFGGLARGGTAAAGALTGAGAGLLLPAATAAAGAAGIYYANRWANEKYGHLEEGADAGGGLVYTNKRGLPTDENNTRATQQNTQVMKELSTVIQRFRQSYGYSDPGVNYSGG